MTTRFIPLAERRCTKCGKGVAEGARFFRRHEKPNGWRPVCVACDSARYVEQRRRRKVASAGHV